MNLKTKNIFFHFLTCFVLAAFSLSSIFPNPVFAQTVLNLPAPGIMVATTAAYVPAILKGVKIYPDNPLRFDFIVDTGDTKITGEELKEESRKLIKYFLASLTVPEQDLWVNLSPYEKDRIIPEKFGTTEMGKDLLAQDYLLKQLTASLIYPEEGLGREFWNRVYKKAFELYGTTNIPINTFNKVWIVPDKAVVYENKDTAFIVESHLKVMLEGDYLALNHYLQEEYTSDAPTSLNEKENVGDRSPDFQPKVETSGKAEIGTDKLPEAQVKELSDTSSQIVRDVILPAIEKEINEGRNFALLRQVYHSLILAIWYKKNLKESILNKVYIDKNKIKGVDVEDKDIRQKIYNQYLEAYKKGVYDYIKQDDDPYLNKTVHRRYVSGGMALTQIRNSIQEIPMSGRDLAQIQNASAGRLHDVAAIASPDPVKAKMLDGYKIVEDFIQRIEKREEGYRQVITATLQPGGGDFEVTFEAMDNIELIYREQVRVIDSYLKEKKAKGTLLEQVLKTYKEEIQNTHRRNKRLLILYNSLTWPRGQYKKEYQTVSGMAREVWSNLESEFGEDTAPVTEGFSDRELNARNQYRERIKEILDLKAKRDASKGEEKRKPNRQLRKKILLSLNEYIALSASARFSHRFRVNLYKSVIADTLTRSSAETQLHEVFNRFGKAGMEEENAIAQNVEDFVYHYMGELSQEEDIALKQAVADKVGDPLRKIKRKRQLRTYGSIGVLGLGIAAAGTITDLEGLANRIEDFVSGIFSKPKIVDVRSQSEKADSLKTPGQAIEGIFPGSKKEKGSEQKPSSGTGPDNTLNQILNSLQFTEVITPAKTEKSSVPAVDPKIEAEKKALQAEIKKMESQMTVINQQKANLDTTIAGLKAKTDNQFDGLKEKADKFEPAGGGKKEFQEPQWNTPSSSGEEGVSTKPKELESKRESLSSEISLGGGLPEHNTQLIRVDGGNGYLAETQYSQINPTQGQWVAKDAQLYAHPINPQEEDFTEAVIMESDGKSRIKVPITSGYVVTGVKAQAKVGKPTVYHDPINGVWIIDFDRDPEVIKVCMRPAREGELLNPEPIQLVDNDGHVLTKNQAEELLKQYFPPSVYQLLMQAKSLPLEDRKIIIQEILEVFFYTTNPLLDTSRYKGQNPVDTMFKYYVGQCNSLTLLNALMRCLLDIPSAVQTGYSDPSFFGHAWI